MRLIDADKLKTTVECAWLTAQDKMQFCKLIDNAPTVEPEKVTEGELVKAYTKGFDAGVETARPQGEWICDDRYLDCRCSICNSYALERGDYPELCPYCPQCGARMEVKTNENNDKNPV